MEAPLIRHLEAHLGTIPDEGNYAFDGDDDPQPHFTVVRFADQPVPGADTLVTVGLSKLVLAQERGQVREELLLSYGRAAPAAELAAILHAVASDVRASGRALLRGSLVGPRGPLVDGSPIEAFVCVHPGYFAEEFDVVRDEDPPIALVWLAPLTAAETWYAAQSGWEALIDLLLEDEQTDLLDLHRDTSPAVLHELPPHDPGYAARAETWAEARFGRVTDVRTPHRPFRLVRFEGATFATIGLSGTELHDRELRHVRQELVLEWPGGGDDEAPWDVLHRLADEMLAHSAAIDDGDDVTGTGVGDLRCVAENGFDGVEIVRIVSSPARV